MQNQKEIEKEKELKKQEKLERRKRKREKLESTHHLFLDPNYDKQKQIIAKDLDEALGKAVAGGQRKRKLISSADPEQDNAESLKVNTDSNEKKSSSSEEIEELTTPLVVQTTSSALIAKLDVKKKVNEKELEKKKEKILCYPPFFFFFLFLLKMYRYAAWARTRQLQGISRLALIRSPILSLSFIFICCFFLRSRLLCLGENGIFSFLLLNRSS